MAAGYDPHEKITVTFTSYKGVGKPEVLTDTEKRTYFAWEIAAVLLRTTKCSEEARSTSSSWRSRHKTAASRRLGIARAESSKSLDT